MNKAILGIFVFAFLLFNNCTKSLGQGTEAGDLLEVPLTINNQQTTINNQQTTINNQQTTINTLQTTLAALEARISVLENP